MESEISHYSQQVARLVAQVMASRKGKPLPLDGVQLDEENIDLLVNALHDTDRQVRRDAAWVLGKMRSVRMIDPLLQYLHDPENRNRGGVVFALGSLDDDRVVKMLLEALQDPDASVRSAAMSHLARRGEVEAIEPFLQAFVRVLDDEEDDPMMRWECVMWIRRLSQQLDDKTPFASITEALETLKTDDDPSMKREVLKTLEWLKTP